MNSRNKGNVQLDACFLGLEARAMQKIIDKAVLADKTEIQLEDWHNNNQLLEEELENAARQMPEDVLVKFYERSQGKLRREAEKSYCLQTIENLLIDMEDYKSKLQYKDKMKSIIEVIDTAITNIETLKSDMEN